MCIYCLSVDVRLWTHDADRMPVHSIPVTLAEVLEVRGMVLDDWELWALLYTASAWLLDLLNRGHFLLVTANRHFIETIHELSLIHI